MPLEVFTARIGTRDADALMIVRWTGGITARSELAFAPSEAILAPAIAARHQADAKRERAAELEKTGGAATAIELRRQADALEATRWAWYEPRFIAEMRVSYGLSRARWSDFEHQAWENGVRPAPEVWKATLARQRVVLECFCAERDLPPGLPPRFCHRRLVAELLAKCGAVYRGEIIRAAPPSTPQPRKSTTSAAACGDRDLKPGNARPCTPPPPALGPLDVAAARVELGELVSGFWTLIDEWRDVG